MKLDIRWQLLLAAICLGLVLSLLSFKVQQEGLCVTSVPAAGGTLVEGVLGLPQFLNPLLSDANLVDQQIVALVFDGLTGYDDRGLLEPALARSWSFEDEGRVVRFVLRDDARWHDGRPVSADDVAFTYGLLQNDAFPAPEGLRTLWQSVMIRTISEFEIEFSLPEPYAPFLDATTRGLLPAHILRDVSPEELANHEFNRSPIGTGPFLVVPGNDWQRSGALRLAPNPTWWREGVQLDGLEFRFYPDVDALVAAAEAGEVHSITTIPSAAVPRIANLPGMRVFTAPAPRYTQLLFNLTGATSSAVTSLSVRMALAYALDRPALIDEALYGQGLPLEGPYLPSSWAFHPELLTTYSFQPATAAALLKESGWLESEDNSVREKDGEELVIRLLLGDLPEQKALADAISRQWADQGVSTELEIVPANDMRRALAEREYEVALVVVEPPGDPDLYDFWSQEAIVRGQNYAGWNRRQASEALEAARQLTALEERRPYYEAFLRFFDGDLPALTLFQHVTTYGIGGDVQEVEVGRIDQPRERYQTLAGWFLRYRQVAVSCPETPQTAR